MSKFLILIYDDEAWLTDETVSAKLMDGHNSFAEKYGPKITGGSALQGVATATSVRPDGGAGFGVTDGPFIESKEVLGGYYLVEAADLDEAIEMAKAVPVNTGGLEVRPVMEMG